VPDQTAAKVIQSGSVIQKQTRVGLGIRRDSQCRVVRAAGQDGQCLFWACLRNDGISVSRLPELDETTWPSFSPTGDEFLVISEGELHRYGYPRGPLHAKMRGLLESQGDKLGDFVYYADADYALATSLNYRLFLVDVENMEIEEEGAILGHQPRPASELYPGRKGQQGLASDLSSYFLFRERGTYRCAANSEASIPRIATIAC
jgi:hypothetical protein